MNKKLNLWLNIVESSFLIIIVSISTLFYFNNYHTNFLGRSFITTGMLFLEVGIVSIELFLFYLQNKNSKIISLAYYIAILFLLMISHIIIPFYGIILIIGLNIAKNYIRIQQLELIYDRDILYDLCDLFHIKIKKTRKKRVTAVKTSTKKATTTRKKTTTAKPKTTKSKATTTRKKTSKSYA